MDGRLGRISLSVVNYIDLYEALKYTLELI